jgi:glycosyltransferase involved in cell wall biosynthesis
MTYPFHVDIHSLFVNKFLKNMEKNIDVIHAHMPLIPAVSTQLPVVTTFHSPWFADSYSFKLFDVHNFLLKVLGVLDFRIEKSLISSSCLVSTVSEGVKLDLERYYGIEHSVVKVFGNAVSDRFLKAGRLRAFKKDPLMILFVGRLDYQKGVLDLVNSMAFVSRRIPEARLVLVGKGPLQTKLMKKVAELNLRNQVEFKGFHNRDEVLEDYLLASVFASPSYSEGLPTTCLEAMACGDAVVATDVRGNSEVVKSGETGLLVPKNEPRLLGDEILRLLEHPDLRERLASNARELIEEKFTWGKVTDRVLEAYFEAVAGSYLK